MLERRFPAGPVPRPVHRLGRFTSGLLVCARTGRTRAWLSARLRDSTTGVSPALADAPSAEADPFSEGRFHKTYQALVLPGRLALAPGESRTITSPIGRHPHPLLGEIWGASGDPPPHAQGQGQGPAPLPARSRITLLNHGVAADLVKVEIATGRPHQVRIHCAALGAPLLGDPLYLPGGRARDDGLPGDGGYHLHACQLNLALPGGAILALSTAAPTEMLTLDSDSGALPGGAAP